MSRAFCFMRLFGVDSDQGSMSEIALTLATTSTPRRPQTLRRWATRAAAPEGQGEQAGRHECVWQREQLPEAVRELVLDEQRLRNDICWSVFDC